MRETVITLLACVMVLIPAPLALAAHHTAAAAAVPGTGQGGVESRRDGPSPSASPSQEPDDPDDPDDPDRPDDRPPRPSRPGLPPWPPGGTEPSASPTPEPTDSGSETGEPSEEPSGTASGPDGEDGDRPDAERDGGDAPGPREAARPTPQGWAEQVSDRRPRGDVRVEDYEYEDDGERGGAEGYAENRATPPAGQLLPVLPLGAGLTFLGLGLAALALRLRR